MATQPILKMIFGHHTAHVRAIYILVSTCPDAHVLLQHPVCTHRRVACLVRHETDIHTHTPSPCVHTSLEQKQGRVKNTSSLPSHSLRQVRLLSLCPLLTAPVWASALRDWVLLQGHMYAQTVIQLPSHEKMFISYMDIQTCMARKTPSLHVP